MSPTPTPADDNIREIERLRQELLDAGIASDGDVVGCTSEQIAEIIASAPPRTVPDEYIAFLQIMGRQAGKLLAGTHAFYPALLDAADVAADIAADLEENLALDNRFFFAHHQGYIVYFLEGGLPQVFGYKEGEPHVYTLGPTFIRWLRAESEATRAAMERIESRDAETEAIREGMRAEGKLNW